MCVFCLHVHSLFLWYQHQSVQITLIPKPESFEHVGNPSLTFHHPFSKQLKGEKNRRGINRWPPQTPFALKKTIRKIDPSKIFDIFIKLRPRQPHLYKGFGLFFKNPTKTTPSIRMDIKSLYHRCFWWIFWRQNSYIDKLGIWMSWSISIPAMWKRLNFVG